MGAKTTHDDTHIEFEDFYPYWNKFDEKSTCVLHVQKPQKVSFQIKLKFCSKILKQTVFAVEVFELDMRVVMGGFWLPSLCQTMSCRQPRFV